MKDWKKMIPMLLAVSLLAGCAGAGADVPGKSGEDEAAVYIDSMEVEELLIEDEAVALSQGPVPVSTMLLPVASGTSVKTTNKATIDYSNVADGYVMASYTAQTDKRLKAKITGPSGDDKAYSYNMTPGAWVTFPLSDGNGEYSIKVLENVQDKKYAVVCSVTVQVTLTDEFAPFVRPNQYVDYTNAENTIAKAKELIGTETDSLKKVEAVYKYVVGNLTYDVEKAASVQTGYLPVLDTVLAEQKGICFDYAALMAGMLRSQSVPCKLVVGYAGTQYHAWISVWVPEIGWVEGVIYFDGTTWQRMDPTFASSAKGDETIMQYIANGDNYTTKYLY